MRPRRGGANGPGIAPCEEPWREPIVRSLITLKALTYGPTGGIVAAATTSLPEKIGGERNWDYRICWLRDSTFTLYALSIAGYYDEAKAWRQWLLRAIAGEPAKMQIMYGLRGERRLTEFEVPWLPGYENSAPVRIGNAAHQQFQLDVYGEVMDSFYAARKQQLDSEPEAEAVEKALMEFLESGVEGARRRNLGSARAAPAFHAFQDDGVGGRGSRRQAGREIRQRRVPSSDGRSCATRFAPMSSRAVSIRIATPSSSTTAPISSMRRY